MTTHPLDVPQIVNNLFFPRQDKMGTHPNKTAVKDGLIAITDEVKLGYRMYIHHTSAPVILYFHGNGEIASDYDSIAPLYHEAGVSLLVVDYRGYGWSTGTPLTSRMLPDAQIVVDKIDTILKDCGIVPGRPLFVKGRSLGSAPAIYLAQKNPDAFKGLIIESGYASAPSLFARLGIALPQDIVDDDDLPLFNSRRMKEVQTPLLVLHGEVDTLIPAANAKEIYNASTAQDKTLHIIPSAGHNNLLVLGIHTYFEYIHLFVEKHS
jgi:alpha-beta hydrolase superfamily lysophospholipase